MKRTALTTLVAAAFLALAGFGYHLAAHGSRPESSAASQFATANRLVADGKLEDAISQYQGLLESGHLSAAIFYNLANAQQRAGNFGAAILNYERAAALTPSSSDISANLERARKDAGAIESAPDGWQTYAGTFSPNGWSILAALCLLALAGAVAAAGLGILTMPPKLAGAGTMAACLTIAASVTALTIQHRNQAGRAIVVADKAPLRVSPFAEAKSLTALPSGKAVRLESGESHGEFRLARLETGQSGWLKDGEVKSITDL